MLWDINELGRYDQGSQSLTPRLCCTSDKLYLPALCYLVMIRIEYEEQPTIRVYFNYVLQNTYKKLKR